MSKFAGIQVGLMQLRHVDVRLTVTAQIVELNPFHVCTTHSQCSVIFSTELLFRKKQIFFQLIAMVQLRHIDVRLTVTAQIVELNPFQVCTTHSQCSVIFSTELLFREKQIFFQLIAMVPLSMCFLWSRIKSTYVLYLRIRPGMAPTQRIFVSARLLPFHYVNCKPVHRSKCVPVNNFEISKECLSKVKNRNSFPIIRQKVQ